VTVAFISSADCGRHDTGWGHPEHVGRLRAITRALREHPELFTSLQHVDARHATDDELGLVHPPAYIEAVRAMARAGGGRLDPDTVVSEGSWDAARAGVGAVLDGVDTAVRGPVSRAFCGVRPPGHHATQDRAMGFCLFSNVAIGARYARQRHQLDRVLIVDWDVHHGNGTQAVVESDRNIHFVSMHQWPWYPGTGPADDRGPHDNVWNVPLGPGLEPHRYVDALTRAIDDATAAFTPDIVLISAGFDSLRDDPLGGFTLEIEHFVHLTRMLVERAEMWCSGRVVSALEGGYAPERVGEAVVAHMGALR
jgi:acetoin utilization deacetylase AcuC-like enzyme